MKKPILRFPIRYHTIDRLYGPGMQSYVEEGLEEKTLAKSPGQLGLVAVHCWNLGEPTGPYPIDPERRFMGKATDWVPAAHRIIREHIEPVFAAARAAGTTVFHLAQDRYAPRYPTFKEIQADPELSPPDLPPVAGCVRPWTYEESVNDVGGPSFPGAVWDTHPEAFDVAEALRPLPDEPVLVNGWQLNGLCRRRDIDTLIYVGFMADICLVNSPGAIRQMGQQFRYRCVALRDCTVAYEYDDTFECGCMNRAAMRLIETGLGYTASSNDFVRAVRDSGLLRDREAGEAK